MAETEQEANNDESYPSPASISAKSPYEWNTTEVAAWIASLSYASEAKKFQTALIDGSKLFTLDRTTLQNDVKVFDVTARNAILTAIDELKKTIRQSQKEKADKFAKTHTRKPGKKSQIDSNVDDQKEPTQQLRDELSNRRYALIKRNGNTSDIGPNYTIQSILDHYDFRKKQDSSLVDADNIDSYALKHCALNQNKAKSVFMFIIVNAETQQFIYLFTKSVEQWKVENVFDFVRNISNKQFVLFADQLKRKKMDGATMLKLDRKHLQQQYGSFTDPVMRRNFLNEIQELKTQLASGNDSDSDKERNNKPRTYHNTHKRTPSEIERNRMKKQQLRKAGPRDVGTIKYSGTKYDESKDKAFLEDTIHPLSKDEKFQKRKEKTGPIKKETVQEIGKIKGYNGLKYDDSNDAAFLDDRVHTLSNDERFQKRKEKTGPIKKETMQEIGKVHGFQGIAYDDSNDAAFLDDRVHTLSKDERFQKRKEKTGPIKKETVQEIGKVQGFQGISYDDSNDAAFLDDRVHTLSKDERFQKRKEQNPLAKKKTVQEIGKVRGYDGIEYDDSADRDAFLSDDAYYRYRSQMITDKDGKVSVKLGPTEIGKAQGFQKPEWSEQVEQELNEHKMFEERVRKEDKDYSELAKQSRKVGAVETGKIHGFDAIDYELTKDDLEGFLAERHWYESSQVSEQFDEGISGLLKSLPAYKLRIMDDVPLPTGYATKITWLKKLRDLIEDELKTEQLREAEQNAQNDGDGGGRGGDADEQPEQKEQHDKEKDDPRATTKMRKEQLDQLNALLTELEDKGKKSKDKEKTKDNGKNKSNGKKKKRSKKEETK
eukprot:CAMPEP_0197034562 /NCGR_PEP_ID=MMETSP1384-20130603/12637_1 /TAXON_ID=29189 /ORGANISM="Ammonia sp." /LENGTH=826 /DNA_ID=CAMNT_0042464507 /DNA_START=21 /DNA_END=2501 /DNA_ORIENTATION=+